MKKWGVVVLAVGLLAGCSEEVTKETKQEPKQEEVKKEVSKPVVKEPTEAEKKAKVKAEITAYMSDLTPVLKDYKTILDGITQLANMGAQDPSLMMTEEYLDATDSVGDAINRVNNNARALDPGDNPTLIKLDKIMDQVIERFQFVADTYPQAVRDFDADAIGESASAVADIGNLMTEASMIVETELTPLMN